MPPRVLQYDRGADPARLDPLRFVLPPLLIPAAVAVFLPFTWGVSPWIAMDDWPASLWSSLRQRDLDNAGLILLGAPFFLAWAALIVRVRMLFRSPMRWAGGMSALTAAAAGAVCTAVSCVALLAEGLDDPKSLIPIAVAAALLLSGGALLVLLRRRLSWAVTGIIALHFAYLANAGLCVTGFWEDSFDSMEIGYRFTLFAIAAAVFDICWTLLRCRRTA